MSYLFFVSLRSVLFSGSTVLDVGDVVNRFSLLGPGKFLPNTCGVGPGGKTRILPAGAWRLESREISESGATGLLKFFRGDQDSA